MSRELDRPEPGAASGGDMQESAVPCKRNVTGVRTSPPETLEAIGATKPCAGASSARQEATSLVEIILHC